MNPTDSGNLFKLIAGARSFRSKLKDPSYVMDPKIHRTLFYRFYSSWERRLEVGPFLGIL